MPKQQDRFQIGEYWLSQQSRSPNWCRTWFDRTTRQTQRASLGTADIEEAKLELAKWIASKGRMTQQTADTVPLETCLVRYYEQHAKHLASAEQARHALAKWSDFFPGALVSEITPDQQRAFVADMRGKGLSDGYIRRTLAIGQAALNRAHREGEISTVPRILLNLAPEGEPRERLMTEAEVKALFDAATEPHQWIYLMLAVATAARPQAILDLTTFQLDCEARLIRLNPAGRAQNKKRRPTLPICEALLPWLRDLPSGPVVTYKGRKLADTRMMLQHLTERAARTIRREAAARAHTLKRVNRRSEAWAAIHDGRGRAAAIREITAYTIRHTVAAEMRKRGVPVWEVAGFLGHSSGYKTTERYAKFGPDHLAWAVRAIDDYCAELGLAPGMRRVACELRVSASEPRTPNSLIRLVEPTGIEPVTSTMPL